MNEKIHYADVGIVHLTKINDSRIEISVGNNRAILSYAEWSKLLGDFARGFSLPNGSPERPGGGTPLKVAA